jgi:chromate transporter
MSDAEPTVPLRTVAAQWTRIGLIGFGGPPAHIALLRELVVARRGWISAREFEDSNAACSLLPGPASTQLSILCAYRVAGPAGAIVGGIGFITPAVILVLALSILVLGNAPPTWIRGAGAGASAAVAAVALHAARGLVGPSLERARAASSVPFWSAYALAGAVAAVLIGPYLVLVLVGCGAFEVARRRRPNPGSGPALGAAAPFSGPLALVASAVARGGLAPLAWTAFKVGALSFGGGFVIIPLMQGDAVHVYHWMSNARFLDAVALGQITPGPVVATVTAVGYAAHGVLGGLLAALVAFTPSFCFVLVGGRRLASARDSPGPRAFLDGAGPAAIGAIAGAAVTLALALSEGWQLAVLAAAAIALLTLRRGIVATLVAAALAGVILALLGAPLP